MSLGHPVSSGYYWCRFYKWNGKTLRYDIKEYEWIPCIIHSSDSPEYQVQIIGSDELFDVRHVWEYETLSSP